LVIHIPNVHYRKVNLTVNYFLLLTRTFIIYNTTNHFLADPIPQEYLNPCEPSPCGTNAICKEQNGAGSCSCLPEYFGNPYEGCKPECVVNAECQSNKACINNKCKDPCLGTCAQNAECQVINHSPTCTCYNGYTGDPFRYCHIIPPQRN